MHNTRVDGGHHKRCAPALHIGAELGSADIGLAGPAAQFRRTQGVRIGQDFAGVWIAARLSNDVDHAGRSAATHFAAHALHAKSHRLQRLTQALNGSILQKPHAEIRGNGVKPAAVHQPRTRLLGRGLVLIQHAPHPRHLTGQITIIGAVGGTGGHQFIAVQGIRTHR